MTTAEEFTAADIEHALVRVLPVSREAEIKRRWHRAYGLRTYLPAAGGWGTPMRQASR